MAVNRATIRGNHRARQCKNVRLGHAPVLFTRRASSAHSDFSYLRSEPGACEQFANLCEQPRQMSPSVRRATALWVLIAPRNFRWTLKHVQVIGQREDIAFPQ